MNWDTAKPFLPGLFFIAISAYLVVDRIGVTRRSIEGCAFLVHHPHLLTWFLAAFGIAVMIMATLEIRQGQNTGVIELCLGLALTLGAKALARVYLRGLTARVSRSGWTEWSWKAGAAVFGLLGVTLLVLAALTARATSG